MSAPSRSITTAISADRGSTREKAAISSESRCDTPLSLPRNRAKIRLHKVNLAPPCYISSTYGNPLEAQILRDIATAFAALDSEFLEVLRITLKNAADGRFNLDESSQRTLQQVRNLILGLRYSLGELGQENIAFTNITCAIVSC